MSPPPTSIDGTDITGATIDGQEVQEITVDGDTVFTAEQLPVSYSNLVAWYPFDSSFYGGSNANDATALFNPAESGDSTAYDGSVSGATHQPSAGATDINAGANSGAFDFDGNDDFITLSGSDSIDFGGSFSLTFWISQDFGSSTGFDRIINKAATDDIQDQQWFFQQDRQNDSVTFGYGQNRVTASVPPTTLTQISGTRATDGTIKLYTDAILQASVGTTNDFPNNEPVRLGTVGSQQSITFFDGTLDDVRIYNKELAASEVQEIYDNTEP